mmetsp:Transcript_53333/g.98620  ORF Transcript_53333/g.98620 Transcript_53333/m.98620 type:complete len:222 (-) Transcript_53333:292-957(-)
MQRLREVLQVYGTPGDPFPVAHMGRGDIQTALESEEQVDDPLSASSDVGEAAPEEEQGAGLPAGTMETATISERAQLLAQKVLLDESTTLQLHGLGRYAHVEDVVLMLNAEGLRGWYNYVSIPRQISGQALGYAFINLTSPECAAWLVLHLTEAWTLRYPCLARAARLTVAVKQGYHAYVTRRLLNKYSGLRSTLLWPLVMTEDGAHPHFGSEEAIAAALS